MGAYGCHRRRHLLCGDNEHRGVLGDWDMVLSLTKSKDENHIPSLDGLRALSFLLVFGAHAGLGKVIPGGFGVSVFFFLTGYLITTLLSKELQSKAINLRHFYLRRVFRILPPFYLILLSAIFF